MIFRAFIVFLIFSFQTNLIAQKIRLPYLNNGKYGIIDEDQRLIVSPFFKEVVVHSEFKLIAVLKNEKWAIYDFAGELLIDHIIEVKEMDWKYGVRGPEIGFLEYRRPKEFDNRLNSNFIYIINDKLKSVYYLNTLNLNNGIKAYKANNYKLAAMHPVLSRYRVINMDDSVNVIDEFGNEILESSVKKAIVLNEKLISVCNDKLFALYNGNLRISDFKYVEIKQTKIKDVFIGKSYKNDGRFRMSYDLIDGTGKVVSTSSRNYEIMHNHIIHCSENNCFILDENLGIVQIFKNCNASWIGLSKEPLIKLKSSKCYGLSDIQGNLVLDTIYNAINSNNSILECTIGKTHSLLDSNLNVLIENDSVLTLNGTKRSDRYTYTKYDSTNVLRRGILNGKNSKLIDIKREKFKTFPCVDYILESNSSSEYTLRNMGDGKIIFDDFADDVRIDCASKSFEIRNGYNKTKKDFDGNILYSYTDLSACRKYKVVKSQNRSELADLEGNVVIDEVFKNVQIITDPVTKKTAYFCTFFDKSISTSIVYNDNLEVISQPGYSISSSWVKYMALNPGRIFVRNDSDVSESEYQFRSGIIDYDGEWILKPSKGMFRFINENLFVVRKEGVEELLFYDANGQPLNTGKYHILQKNISTTSRQNRIAIATINDNDLIEEIVKNKEINKYNISAIKNFEKEISKANNNIRRAIGENNFSVKYGYINDMGLVSIASKFIKASNFDHTLPQARVKILDKKNNVRQCLIDTSGNVIFSLPCDTYLGVSKGYYKCGKEGKYKLMDSKGTELFTNVFRGLIGSSVRSNLITGNDEIGCFIIDLEKRLIHRQNVAGTIELLKFSDKYFLGCNYGIPTDEQVFLLFNNDLKLIEEFNDIYYFSSSFNGAKLPEDYINIVKKDGVQVIYSIRHKTFLKT